MVNYLRVGIIATHIYLLHSIRVNLALSKYFKNCHCEKKIYYNKIMFL